MQRSLRVFFSVFGIFILFACAHTASKSSTGGLPTSSDNALEHHVVTPQSLPEPFATGSATNPSRVIARPEGAQLNTRPGFKISTYAEGGFKEPRWMALAPNGDVFLADSRAGQIIILRDTKGAGQADQRFTFATGLTQPFGLAFWRDYLYAGDTNAVVRFKYRTGQTKADGAPEKIADLPGFGYNQHWTRNVIFNPEGTKMYVTVGSATNVDAEKDPMRAEISEYNPDGTGHRFYATGTRNPVGLAFNPVTKALWAAVEERDGLGDDLVPEYVTSIKDGGFYGWPFAYIGQHEDPRRKGERPDLVAKAIVPDVLIQAHSAVLGLAFYDGNMFPQEYRGDAFVACHGSWNRANRTGYNIVRIHFENGKPAGGYDDFVTGWMVAGNNPNVWGRPVGLLVLKDGSMLIADDGGRKIWRVTYLAQ
ncbi:MAG TPA: sorbosone dehydrogenase family protein [Blastocatellia bacterium]|nr:sorbosone dehydrogenase family protein [Blastocatellia bacterium]